MSLPLVAITMGDAAGVGPELCLQALAGGPEFPRCIPIVFGEATVLGEVARLCRLPEPAHVLSRHDWDTLQTDPEALCRMGPVVVDLGELAGVKVRPGVVQAACGRASFTAIRTAVEAARTGRVCAVVTAPIHKEALAAAGVPFPGHTEMLAHLTGVRRAVMMMASDPLIVALVTTHVRLANVTAQLTREIVQETIEWTARAVCRLRGRPPRLVVCGLNPHAGEGGLFGDEERACIEPAVRAAREAGWEVQGPIPADTAFLPERRRETDAYIAMYHDQGLIPFKMLAFEEGVNVTLGLPIVRTSVDHGTAFDIAWQGRASPRSLFAAVRWALQLAQGGLGHCARRVP